MKQFRVLMVDDDQEWSQTFKENLETVAVKDLAGKEYDEYLIEHVTSQADADRVVAATGQGGYDLVLLDLRYPLTPGGPLEEDETKPFQGMSWLPTLRELQPGATIIILTTYADRTPLEQVVAAIRDHSANDFIPKVPSEFDDIVARIQVACGNAQRIKQHLMLEEEYWSLVRTRAARTYSEDVAALIRQTRTSLEKVSRQIETRDPTIMASAATAIRSELDYLSSEFQNLTDLLNVGQEQISPCDVSALVRDMLALHQRMIDSARIRAVGPGETESLTLRTFQGDVRVALHEVINNALDSLRRLDSRTRERELKVTTEKADGSVVIRIADTGAGLDKEAIKNLYKRGFTTSKDDKHRGWGLYIAQRMMQEIGGQIEVRDGRGGGVEVLLKIRDLRHP